MLLMLLPLPFLRELMLTLLTLPPSLLIEADTDCRNSVFQILMLSMLLCVILHILDMLLCLQLLALVVCLTRWCVDHFWY